MSMNPRIVKQFNASPIQPSRVQIGGASYLFASLLRDEPKSSLSARAIGYAKSDIGRHLPPRCPEQNNSTAVRFAVVARLVRERSVKPFNHQLSSNLSNGTNFGCRSIMAGKTMKSEKGKNVASQYWVRYLNW